MRKAGCHRQQPGSLIRRVFVGVTDADTKRSARLSISVSNWNHDGAVDTGISCSWPDAAAFISLNVAARDRLVSLKGKSSHSFANRDPAHNFGYMWRQPHLGFKDQHSAFEQMDRACIGMKLRHDGFELRLHVEKVAMAAPASQSDQSGPSGQSLRHLVRSTEAGDRPRPCSVWSLSRCEQIACRELKVYTSLLDVCQKSGSYTGR